MIKVKSNLPENRIALWDRDKLHKPDGEIFIKGGQSVEVELTDGVKAALRDGRLVQVSEEETPSVPVAPPSSSTKKRGGEVVAPPEPEQPASTKNQGGDTDPAANPEPLPPLNPEPPAQSTSSTKKNEKEKEKDKK